MTVLSARPMPTQQPKPLPVQCALCRKLFTVGGDMTCGATVPTHMANGQNGAWCKTDDILMMLVPHGEGQHG